MLTCHPIIVAANNPNFQMQHQQQAMIAQQRAAQQARQQMLAQHYSGMPVNMPNGMNQMTQAQYQAMRGGPTMARPVNLPQHLQQQQAGLQAQHTLEQQQQAQAQHQVCPSRTLPLERRSSTVPCANNSASTADDGSTDGYATAGECPES
jgi:hypothetical protein